MVRNANFSVVTTVHFHPQCAFHGKIAVLEVTWFHSVYSVWTLCFSVRVSCWSQQHSVVLHMAYGLSTC